MVSSRRCEQIFVSSSCNSPTGIWQHCIISTAFDDHPSVPKTFARHNVRWTRLNILCSCFVCQYSSGVGGAGNHHEPDRDSEQAEKITGVAHKCDLWGIHSFPWLYVLDPLTACTSFLFEDAGLLNDTTRSWTFSCTWISHYLMCQNWSDMIRQIAYSLAHLMSILECMEPAWSRALLKRTRFIDPDFQGDILAVISQTFSAPSP